MAIKPRHVVGATSAAVFAAAVALVTQWEGLSTKPYRDVVGVWTVCIGQTAVDGYDVHRTYSVAECKAMLAKSLVKYDEGIKRCIHREMPDSVHVALISIAYNVGVGAVCNGSIARRANAGDWRGTCDALLMYDRAGGRKIRGLTNRRESENEVCLKGLK